MQAAVTLSPNNDSFDTKTLFIKETQTIKIGRKVSNKTTPSADNGFFDAKVLSRNHEKIFFENNKIYI